MPQKDSRRNESGTRKQQQKPNESFLTISRAAALQQTKIHMKKKPNRSFIRINKEELIKSPTIDVIALTSDSTQNSPQKVYISNNQFDFMVTSPNSPEIPPPFTFKISTPKIDKAVKKIQHLNTTPTSSNLPIEYQATPSGETPFEVIALISIITNKKPINNTQAPITNAISIQKQTTEVQRGPNQGP